jgi:NADPH-dependent ferric siderophore reductase
VSSTVVLERPAYRPYRVHVAAVRRLSPSFVRVTFRGDDLDVFGTAGLDQRIKLLLPAADGRVSALGEGDWYQAWRDLPAETRSPLRTYTVRRIDVAAGELDVDFVVHHEPGPAGAWAEAAEIGHEIVIVGPDERSAGSRSGMDWHPGTARRVLLVGDETAVPAIGGIVESLDDDIEVEVFVEVPHAADRMTWRTGSGTRVQWIARDGAPHGEKLIDAVSRWCAASADLLSHAAAPRPQRLDDVDVDIDMIWDSPADADRDFYAWMAGESATVKTLRRMLVSTHGVDRSRVAFMGYWRLGQSERQG